jgi:hypothetical protein
MERAREILIDELSQGRTTIDDIAEADELAAILYRYGRAAQEGAARLNLRLMAKVIAGQKESRTLTANEFLYHAEILASLRREEIVLLSTLYRHWKAIPDEESKRTDAAQKDALNELVPGMFNSRDEFMATAGAITRTGLVIGTSVFSGTADRPSPLFDKLYTLAPFEGALAREGAS